MLKDVADNLCNTSKRGKDNFNYATDAVAIVSTRYRKGFIP